MADTINGIVRNLLRDTFYLRIPGDRDRPGTVIPIPPSNDIELDAADFATIYDLIFKLDRRGILRIIQLPKMPEIGSPNSQQVIYQATPPTETNVFWVSTVTNDLYVYDPTTQLWRSTNPDVIPFIRNFSQGTPLLPYGAVSSYPLFVNNTQARNLLVYKMFCYVNDRSGIANTHRFTISSTGAADEQIYLINGQSTEITTSVTRILAPTQTLEIRHGPELQAFYINITVELAEVIAP